MADVRILPEHEFLALAEGFTDQTYEQSVTYAPGRRPHRGHTADPRRGRRR
ncbi:MAG: hypothetical protein R2694_08560 [Ilumatobacteraceae bacterium]